jgi:protein O-mannosyl-transferase
LIFYLRYLDGKEGRAWLLGAFASFVLSVAAKPAAVVFPVTLLALDYFRHRRFAVRSIAEKAPFFAISIVGGLLTLGAQKAGGAIAEQWTLWERVCFACYGALMYVVKLFLPFRLAAIYPYPMVSGVPLSPQYATSFVALLIVAPVLFLLFRRIRVVMFGLAFYAINVALVLQLATVGGAVMADRYTYLPYVGLLLALAWWLDEPRDRIRFGPIVQPALVGVFAVLLPVSLVQTWKRCEVWRNAETLWNDTIGKYPGQIADAYNDRGYYYYHDAHRYQEAVADFSTAIHMNSTVAKFWLNKGNALAALDQNDSAFACFDRTLALKPGMADAWNNRAGIKLRWNDLPGALADYTRAIELDPRHRDAHANRAMVEIMTRRFESAIEDSRRAIELDPANSANYLQAGSIGYALLQLGRHREAIAQFDDAIRTSPSGEPRLGAYYLYRSVSRSALGDTTSALQDAVEARRLGASVDAAYLHRLGG